MSIITKMKEEFYRAPVATLAGPIGILVGLASIAVSWLIAQPVSPKAGSQVHSAAIGAGAGVLYEPWSTPLIFIGVFLILTPSFALLCKTTYKYNKFFAVFCSPIIASISIFLNRLNANIMGIAAGDQQKLSTFDDLTFYGTVALFIAIAGRDVVMDFGRSMAQSVKDEEGESAAAGILGLGAILVIIWCLMVDWGQRHLIDALLD